MTSHCRKLLLLPADDAPKSFLTDNSGNSLSSSNSSSISIQLQDHNYGNNASTVTCSSTISYGYNSYRLSPPFDSSMALTVLVLLAVLFFMGFFSIYIGRFANDANDIDRTRRRTRHRVPPPPVSSALEPRLANKGVDPSTIQSLPAYAYDQEDGARVKQRITECELDCAICLSEFEEGECVKVIPFCGHLFHVECIDTWLSCHVTCPLCRTAQLFPADEVKVGVEDKEEGESDLCSEQVQVGVENCVGVSMEVSGGGMNRRRSGEMGDEVIVGPPGGGGA